MSILTGHWLTDDSHDALWNRLGGRGGGDAVTDRLGVLLGRAVDVVTEDSLTATL